jgi:hypothetical protein
MSLMYHFHPFQMSNVKKTLKENKENEDEDDDSESDSDSDDESSKGDLPRLDCTMLPHKGCINRVRVIFFGQKQ